jgi:hypothetical protein
MQRSLSTIGLAVIGPIAPDAAGPGGGPVRKPLVVMMPCVRRTCKLADNARTSACDAAADSLSSGFFTESTSGDPWVGQ